MQKPTLVLCFGFLQAYSFWKKKKKNPFFYIHPLLFSPLAIDVNLSCAFLLVALFTHASNANEVVYILQKSIRFF